MAVIAPPRQPDSRDTESTAEPGRGGEALIEEAKQHARLRRRRVRLVAVVASIAVCGAATAVIIGGGSTGSSSDQLPGDGAAADFPVAAGAPPSEGAVLLSSWGRIHEGWALVYDDGRALLLRESLGPVTPEMLEPGFELPTGIVERTLSQDGLELVRSGALTAGTLFEADPPLWDELWAEPGFRTYMPEAYAVCHYVFAGPNGQWAPVSGVLDRLPLAARELAQGTEQVFPHVVFEPDQFPTTWGPTKECFALSVAGVAALVRLSDAGAIDDRGMLTFTTGTADPLDLTVEPVMPGGGVVHWGG